MYMTLFQVITINSLNKKNTDREQFHPPCAPLSISFSYLEIWKYVDRDD